MTAKPQPMAGQSDAADDLIAELAKLMAQDAQGERPAQPAIPAFSVRIPGGEPEKPASPAQNFDFLRAAASQAQPAAKPVATPQPDAAPHIALDGETPEPFRFDFSPAPKPAQAAPVAAAPQAPAPQPVSSPEPVSDHDSIADLIAAELLADPSPTPAAPPTARTNEPVVSSEPRPAPVRTGGWAPTAVAANLGGHDGQPRAAIRPVNLQPASRSEQDQFKVPPVFGLGTTPAPEPKAPVFEMPADLPVEPEAALAQPEYVPPSPVPPSPVAAAPVEPPVAYQPAVPAPVVVAPPQPTRDDDLGLDPIDEIESLIGRAMRVEFDKPVAEERPAPSPALRSLATPTMPSPAPHALSGADEAIFAAAQATGAQVGWVEAPEVSEAEPEPVSRRRAKAEHAPRRFGMTRALAGPLVAVTLLLAAGFGLYWVLGLRGESGPAPLLTADATPTKETPAVQPDPAAGQQSVVFNEMDGVVPGAEEQLVSRDQSDVNEVTQVAATPDLSEEGLANRKVRTVTVRPDGTIVSGDDGVAGSAILPVDRPNVPAVPGAETASPELLAAAQPEPVTPAPVVTPEAAPTPTPAPVAAVAPAQPGSTVPAFDQAGNAIAGKTTVVPLLRPSTFAPQAAAAPVNAFVDPAAAVAPVSAELQQPVAAAPVAQPAAIPAGATEVAAVGNDAPAYVQLASQRSEAEARATAGAMVTRFGPLFGGANMEVQRVDLGAKGIYYRVRVPANSIQEANSMCTNVKAAGGDCFTM